MNVARWPRRSATSCARTRNRNASSAAPHRVAVADVQLELGVVELGAPGLDRHVRRDRGRRRSRRVTPSGSTAMPVPYTRDAGRVDRPPAALAVGPLQVVLELERDLRLEAARAPRLDGGLERAAGSVGTGAPRCESRPMPTTVSGSHPGRTVFGTRRASRSGRPTSNARFGIGRISAVEGQREGGEAEVRLAPRLASRRTGTSRARSRAGPTTAAGAVHRRSPSRQPLRTRTISARIRPFGARCRPAQARDSSSASGSSARSSRPS